MTLDPSAVQTVTAERFPTHDDYLEYLYRIFISQLVNDPPVWAPNKTLLSCRRGPEFEGRHYSFWHVISKGGKDPAGRVIQPERCRRIHLIRQMLVEFSSIYPDPGNGDLNWWIQDNSKSRHTRYALSLSDFSYLLIVEQREGFAMLVTAYDVLKPFRQKKYQRQWKSYWAKAGAAR